MRTIADISDKFSLWVSKSYVVNYQQELFKLTSNSLDRNMNKIDDEFVCWKFCFVFWLSTTFEFTVMSISENVYLCEDACFS